MERSSSRAVAHLALYGATILGWASMLAFMGFLLLGAPAVLDPGLDRGGSLGLDAALCLVFFVQHSGMIRRSFRVRLARVVHERYLSAVYTVVSAVLLLVLVLLWQETRPPLVEMSAGVRWSLRVVAGAAIAGIGWGLLSLGSFDAFGLSLIRDHLRGTRSPSLPFTVRGPYRWVRHPLYLFYLVLFWAYPDPTMDRLLFNVLWTVWTVVGSVLEERDLVAVFGETYREYQRRVPMLVPWRLVPAPASSSMPSPRH